MSCRLAHTRTRQVQTVDQYAFIYEATACWLQAQGADELAVVAPFRPRSDSGCYYES